MKKIAIVVALQSEFELVRTLLQPIDKASAKCGNRIKGEWYGHEVLLTQSGIGKVNAAIQVTEIINDYRPDYVINSGVAGGIGSGLKAGDVVVATDCVYHDVWCGEGLWGQIQGYPLKFASSKTLLDILHQLADDTMHFGLICTGDQFITENIRLEEILNHFPEGQAVDMESCAMAHVCYQKQVPFISIRVISDTPLANHDNTAQYFDFWKDAPQRTFHVLQRLVEHLD